MHFMYRFFRTSCMTSQQASLLVLVCTMGLCFQSHEVFSDKVYAEAVP